jgi:nitrate/TMAO reductase-like tetraheme cytochrome c subunit
MNSGIQCNIKDIFFLLCAACISVHVHADDLSFKSHENLFDEKEYPTAADCATCHPQHYKEWSVSPHAYAQISPVFNAMHAATVQRTNGTAADFCIRCHTPIGMQMGEPVFQSNLERAKISNEGVTCIACHRRDEPLGKTSGRFKVYTGGIFAPVFGPEGGEELRRVIESGKYAVSTSEDQEGRKIHKDAKKFFQLTNSSFCGTCHDVNAITGFRLEEAFSEYKSAPAAAEGISCQDCHMGKEPGVDSGYDIQPVALVGGIPTRPRKKTNHMFVGPDYSVVHPGIFPHNERAYDFATTREWISFNYKAGWGTDDFEDEVDEEYEFPERWSSVSERYEARRILEDNLELLELAAEERKKLLREGYQIGQVVIDPSIRANLSFKVEVKNGTNGHNVPTGFDAERIVFLRVELKDAEGRQLFVSGDLDPNGDLRDNHSLYVKKGKLERDHQLFSLQSKFLVTMIRGGEREEILPINNSFSPLPFQRPPVFPTLLRGRPADARKHRKSIPPLGSVWAPYKVRRSTLKDAVYPLRLNVKIVAGMVPVHLVHDISDMGFDYEMSPREVAEAVVQGHQVLWEVSYDLNEE